MSRLPPRDNDALRELKPTLAQRGRIWLMRILSLYCLYFGLFYWVRLIGLEDGALWRFDLMPVQWKVASASLAALYPCAAMGLWMGVSWGAVLWIIAAGAEIAMYLWLPHLFGRQQLVVIAHFAGIAVYLAFVATEIAQKRSKRASAH